MLRSGASGGARNGQLDLSGRQSGRVEPESPYSQLSTGIHPCCARDYLRIRNGRDIARGLNMTKVTRPQLLQLAQEVSPIERQIIETVARFDLIAHTSLHTLFLDPVPANGRQGRRVLARLCESQFLARLERRIGGRRAGSAGYVYRLGPVGQRLIAHWRGEGLPRGRRAPEPGSLFVRHTLSITEIFVELIEAERAGVFDLLEFTTEPDCWRIYSDPIGSRAYLKPDAFARVAHGAYEDRLFIESDLATEGRGTLKRKCETYVDYLRSGIEQAESGVFPRVLWLVPTAKRAELLIDICSNLDPEHWPLFAVITRERLIDFATSTGNLDDDIQGAVIGGSR